MRPCRASCEARSSMVETGSCCSSATGLCPRRRHKPGSRSRNRLVVSWSQLHHRLLARRRSRSCVGATNCPWVRARLTTCESWCPAALIAATMAGSNARAVTVCTTSTPCSRPRSIERDAEERAIRILAGVLEVLEARMRGRVVHDQRPQLLGDEADQAFVEPHADPADAIGLQADGGGEDQVRAIGAEQVDGADVGAEAALNELDDVGQRLGGVAGHRGEAADVVERPGGRRRRKRGGVAHGSGPFFAAGPSGPRAASGVRLHSRRYARGDAAAASAGTEQEACFAAAGLERRRPEPAEAFSREFRRIAPRFRAGALSTATADIPVQNTTIGSTRMCR